MENADNVQLTPPTEAQLATVARIKDELGILTVRDRTTYAKSLARPYGEMFTPVLVDQVRNIARPERTIQRRRVIEIHFRDSHVFPDGVPIGATQTFRRTQEADMGPDSSFRFVSVKYDIIQDEMKRVRAAAYERTWLTQDARLADERRKSSLRVRAQEQSLTPSESVGKAVAAGIAEAMVTLQKQGAVAVEDAPPKKKRGRPRKVQPEPEMETEE